jgi:hypothetical protein
MDSLLILLGMTRQDAEDYCREHGIPYTFVETKDPRFAECGPTVRRIVRVIPGDGQWQLVFAPFEMGG